MIKILTYTLIAFAAFFASHLWLQKTKVFQTQKNVFFKNFAQMFFYIISFCFILFYFICPNKDFIYPPSFWQIIIPLLSLFALLFFSNKASQTIACIIISLCIPNEAISNYIPDLNFYIYKAIIIISFCSFSFLLSTQKRLTGVPFIEKSALGFAFFVLSIISATPQYFGTIGLIFAILSISIYYYTKLPTTINTTKEDNVFFGVFFAWFVFLTAPEYGIYSSLAVFAMFFINAIYQFSNNLLALDFKKNFDIYYLSITKGKIDEKDLYSFTIKVYIVMIFIAISAAKISNPSNIFVVATAFGIWFLSRSYNLYQSKASWKNIYQDIKKDILDKKNDKDA